jgi:hypothetical protein
MAAAALRYPLIILTQDGKKEVARETADESGNYRVALTPGRGGNVFGAGILVAHTSWRVLVPVSESIQKCG